MANEKKNHFNFQHRKETNDLYQSVYTGAVDQYGMDVYFMPLDTGTGSDTAHGIWNEIQRKNYDSMYRLRMLSEDQSVLSGPGDQFGLVGLLPYDEITLFVTRKEFIERITGEVLNLHEHDVNVDDKRYTDPTAVQPRISDLVFVPLWDTLFEVTYVADEESMIGGFRAFFKLICKKYEVNQSDTIDIVDEDGSESQSGVINKIDSDILSAIDNDAKQVVEDATDIDTTQTGFEANPNDDIVNDDIADARDDLISDDEDLDIAGKDLFGDF